MNVVTHRSVQMVPRAELSHSQREPLTDTVTVSTRRRIEPRTSYNSSFVCNCRHGRHTLAAVCATLTAFCVTVATSSELAATVDRDGQSINSARARTPHEPLSAVLMRLACGSHAVAITLTSAHWQQVGRRPGRPLNAARSAGEAGACAESCIPFPGDFALGCHKVMELFKEL